MNECKYQCGRSENHEHELISYKGEVLQDNEFDLKNGRALPGGWSNYEVWHNDKRIGFVNAGNIELSEKEYEVINYKFEK